MPRVLLCCSEQGAVGAEAQIEMEEEPLKVPEDIIEAVEMSKVTGDHAQIHDILNNRRINLRSRIDEGDRKRTVLRKLLDDAVNGDKIVAKQLDKNVRPIGESEDSLQYGTEIDFEGIFRDGSGRQTRVVQELLELRAASGEAERRAAYTRLITHPVVATFIHLKWRKARWFFFLNSTIFGAFLLLYSLFINHLFSRPEVYCKQIQAQIEKNGDKQSIIFLGKEDHDECLEKRSNFYTESSAKADFLTDWDEGFVMCEGLFLVLLVLLTLFELYQAYVLRLQYLKELENWIEWVVILSAATTILMKQTILERDTSTETSAWGRGLAALGICAAWLELIFIIGRYPFRGGDFSIMFYNIIKKTFRYVIAMVFMVLGFSFALMVVNFGIEGDVFQNPVKSSMMTLTMVLGEFNFGDMYAAFGTDTVSRGFAMFLLLLLIVLGTINMINLFVVVIISDMEELREEVFHQSLVNMATFTILVEALLPARLLARCRVEERAVLCGHTLCPAACPGDRLGGTQAFRHIRRGVAAILGTREGALPRAGPPDNYM